MANLLKYAQWHRFGVNSTGTARTGTPSSYTTIPVLADGVNLAGSIETENLDTEHKDNGVRWSLLKNRNREKGTIRCPLFPENVFLLLNSVLALNGNGIPDYYAWETWFTNTVDTATGKGRYGILPDGFSLGFNRKDPNILDFSLEAFANQVLVKTSAAPSPSFPAQNPYDTKGVFCDFIIANTSNVLGAISGDLKTLRQLSIQFGNNLDLDLHLPDPTGSLNMTWTDAMIGLRGLQFSGTLAASDIDHMTLPELGERRKLKIRLACVGGSPTGSTTSTANVTAGATKTITVASTTGFAVNDYVIIYQTTANKFCVAKVTTVNAGVSLVVDTMDQAMDGSAGEALTIKNTAFEFTIPLGYVKSATDPVSDGNMRVVNFTGEALLDPTQSALYTFKGYNDDNT